MTEAVTIDEWGLAIPKEEHTMKPSERLRLRMRRKLSRNERCLVCHDEIPMYEHEDLCTDCTQLVQAVQRFPERIRPALRYLRNKARATLRELKDV